MKRIFACTLAISLCLASCNRDDDDRETTKEVETLAEQNANDDQAIAKYLDEHYLDAQGLIKAFSATDTSDDNETKLSALNPQTLPSGVVYIVRQGAQPASGTAIGETDVIHLMTKTTTFLSRRKDDGTMSYGSEGTFINTIDNFGTPDKDPYYYYVKKSVLDKASSDIQKQRSYYEIEGFKEALKHFQAFDQEDSAPYNLQGVIIVPSRAAYARDLHYPNNIYRNRSFVFNFQVYQSKARTSAEE